MGSLLKTERSFGRVTGSSPSDNKYYVLVMFDISGRKKYTLLTKLLKRYGSRIQNSVYEAHLRMSDYKKLLGSVDRLMGSARYYDPADKIRIYKISSACQATIFGEYEDDDIAFDRNLFI